MRKPIVLKHADEALEALNIEVELDRERKVVTLHMKEFDAELVATFVTEALPYDFGVRIDDSLFEHVLKLPLYELVIALAGRHHPACVLYLSSGRRSARLGEVRS